jgi:hypothetical protein
MSRPPPRHLRTSHPKPAHARRGTYSRILCGGVVALLGLVALLSVGARPLHREAPISENCRNAMRDCTGIFQGQALAPDSLARSRGRRALTTTVPVTRPPKPTLPTGPRPSTPPPGAAANRSGLPWSSGAAGDNLAGFAAWRGRPLDNTTIWPNRGNWREISHPDVYGAISAQPKEITLSLGLAMLPEPANGANFAECATGAYDQYYRTYGSELVRLGRADSIVRLGWEANGDWYSWSIGSQVSAYKECFRRQVAAIRSTDPKVRIDWNMNKDSHISVSVSDAYPGNDVVDIVGVDFYDMWPAYPDRTSWKADLLRTQKGGPRGLGAWLAFAKAHSKPLSVPEWGTTPGGSGGGGGDHTAYVQGMHGFFAAHASDIAYETYFNIDQGFKLWPSTVYPGSAADYRARF